MGLGDNELMLDGDGWHVEADHGPGLARVVAGGTDHVFANYVALEGLDQPFAARRRLDGLDLGTSVNLGAATSRNLGQRLSEVGGLDIAVLGMDDGADDPFGIAQGPDLLDLFGGQKIDFDTDSLGDAGVEPVFVHAFAAGGEAYVAAPHKADGLARLLLQGLVQGDRILVNLTGAVAHVEERKKPGGVPRGAGRELGAFD